MLLRPSSSIASTAAVDAIHTSMAIRMDTSPLHTLLSCFWASIVLTLVSLATRVQIFLCADPHFMNLALALLFAF